jgi:hypothetical protein
VLGIDPDAPRVDPSVERDLVHTIRTDLREDICHGRSHSICFTSNALYSLPRTCR